MKESKICLALDGLSEAQAIDLTSQLAPWCHSVKIHDLYDARGAAIIAALKKADARRVWVDAKLHDTKETVALRAKALARNGADIITVHASGQVSMMKAAIEGAVRAVNASAEIWAITVLTSLDQHEAAQIYGKDRTLEEIVLDFALIAKEAGVQGIVCSAKEVGLLSRSPELAGMRLVVPGTRSRGVAAGQQKRLATPLEAMTDGATLLVAGSQVTKASAPVAAFKEMAEEIGMSLD